VIIPIGHDHSIRRYPWVTIGIIALCTVIQIWATVTTPSRDEIRRLESDAYSATSDEEIAVLEQRAQSILDRIPAWRFGYHMGEDEEEGDTDSGLSYRLLTSAFIHEGWIHLIGNMLFLWLVGSALEDRWGRTKFLLFYLFSAVMATLAFKLTYHGPPTMLIGASGAVSAGMGAFLVYFYKTEITLWYFLMYRTGTFRLAAYIALPLWLGDQVLMANLETATPGQTSVAYAAHIGGFAFGFVAAIVIQMVWGNTPPVLDDEEVSDGELPEARAVRAGASTGGDGRERQLIEAIARRELGTVRTLGSRVMIDLSRAKDHARILEMYRSIARAGFTTMPLTDGAFVAATAAADAQRDYAAFVEIAEAMRAEHPGSVQVPKVQYRLAELHAQNGREDLELATLQHLAERYPRHEHGAMAAKALAKRSV
jgi:membrane associated rhomboid family serine protease